MNVKPCIVLVISLFCWSHPVATAGDVSDVIETRQQAFKSMGRNMKAIKLLLKKDAIADPALTAAVQDIADTSEGIANWFPHGSGMDDDLVGAGGDDIETDALNYIWKNTGKFDRLSQEFVIAIGAFAQASKSGDQKIIETAFVNTKDACSNCHRSFRAD